MIRIVRVMRFVLLLVLLGRVVVLRFIAFTRLLVGCSPNPICNLLLLFDLLLLLNPDLSDFQFFDFFRSLGVGFAFLVFWDLRSFLLLFDRRFFFISQQVLTDLLLLLLG